MELIVIVLLIARALSRRFEPFKRTAKIIADKISTTAPKMPSTVPRNGLIWRKVGARTGAMGKSENGKTTKTDKINKLTLYNIHAFSALSPSTSIPTCLSFRGFECISMQHRWTRFSLFIFRYNHDIVANAWLESFQLEIRRSIR